MSEIAPMLPLCYRDTTLLPRVVAPPYDVIDDALRAALGRRHEYNVVHLDLPEGEGDDKYAASARLFSEWQKRGVLVRQSEPAFYRYAQTFAPPGGGSAITRRGFFALIRAVPFSERSVLPHERTLTGPKLDRMKLSRATRATLSPQFMLYSDPHRVLDADLDGGAKMADFSSEDGVRHELWRVTAPMALARVTSTIAQAPLYIADGHHRYETAVALAQEIDAKARAQGMVPSSRAEHLFTFALLANGDDPGLVVFPTHRLLHSLPDFDFDTLIERAGALFVVEPVSGAEQELIAQLRRASGPAVCAVAQGGRAVLLTLRSDADLGAHPVLGKRSDVVRRTAVALLHDGLIEHVLGVSAEAQAAKTNIRYVQEARAGLAALESGTAQVLFLMNPTPVSTIREVADAGEVMPQKSTYFYPKVLTGLFFHTLDPGRAVDGPA
jgi:uncharacterized protein (DUF1015 family)